MPAPSPIPRSRCSTRFNAADLPVIEVHLSNIFRRESFRHHSYVSLAARGVIFGLGPQGYELALEALASLIEAESSEAPR